MKAILTMVVFLVCNHTLLAQNTVTDTLPAKINNSNSSNKIRNEISLGKETSRKNDSLKTEVERKLFGYAIFHNTTTNFAPNLNMATPKNYIVGPGDILSVQVYGIAQNTYKLIVNNEGNINIQDIGVAQISGLTIEAVKSLLVKKLGLRYSGMNSSNPNTFIEVSLDNIRSIKVNMVGEVFTPGTYTLPSYVNIFNALFAAGGPTVKGTFRYVQVYRANKLAGEIDLYEYIASGKATQNIRLQDNDVILVRPSSNQVEIVGEIRIPGLFEMKTNESFQDLLNFAGGFSGNAYKQLVRVNRKGPVDKQIFDLISSQFQRTAPQDGDLITVDPISDRFSNRVQVTGSVLRPGGFELSKGMTARDLIQKAGGLKGDAFLSKVFLYRTRPDFTQEIITFDLSKKNENDNILLEKEDVLSIPSLYDLKEEYYVQVSGEVNNSGIFPYSDSLTVEDLIIKAGGFKYSASGSYIEIVRRNNSDPGKVADIINVNISKDLSIKDGDKKIVLLPFDHVFVRNTPGFQLPKLVSIQGEVQYGGTFAIDKKEMKISDLLSRAGGLTRYAYIKGATLLRRTKKYSSPSVSEMQNDELVKLLNRLKSDQIMANTESNKEYIKRIQDQINQNTVSISKEAEIKNKETLKKDIVKENAANIQAANTKVIEEKEEDLVAIDLEAILKQPGGAEDLVLKNGDILNIPEKLETVSVKGGVLYPVSVRYEPHSNFKDYINSAGGYDTKAFRNKAYVLQANGKIQRVKTVLFFKSYPKIEPGAEIIVPAALTDKPPFNYGNTVGLITSFITATLTLIFLFKNL